jgi:hypothetical protein
MGRYVIEIVDVFHFITTIVQHLVGVVKKNKFPTHTTLDRPIDGYVFHKMKIFPNDPQRD